MLNKRLELIDSIRGLALISMIAYHLVWDLVYMYNADWRWFSSSGAYIWQQSICWTFIILSGFSFPLGNRHLKHGLLVFGGGVVVSAVTVIFMPHQRILFGILTLIGSCLLIMISLEKLLKKLSAKVGAIISLVLFILTRNLSHGYLGFEKLNIIKLPDGLYSNLFTAYLGFPPSRFFSTDYFPLFPWLFLFIFGYFLFGILKEKCLVERIFSKGKIPLVNFLGKHSLIIYMLHQPIIYGICEAVSFMLK